ncbi:unnamed protein product [Owenia fusiformis]|uniref:Uncharacterized protein n=1 Tax=Owenia fusiformis TaxID=6347 RepID=A0A8J1UJX4_OWEFU|nr:unnamed protein product [Owenia fusiformis]
MKVEDTIDVIFIILTATIGIPGNILIIVAIIYDKRLRVLPNIFTGSIAIADIIILVTANPTIVISIQNDGNVLSDTFCQLGGAMVNLSCGVSINTFAVLAVNRYMYICNKKMYEKYFNSFLKSMMFAVAAWIYIVLWMLPSYTGWTQTAYMDKQYFCAIDHTFKVPYTMLLSSVGIGLPALVTFATYMKIYLVVRKSSKSVQSHNVNSSSNNDANKKARIDKQFKQIIVFVIVSMMFVVLWAPYAISILFDMNNSVPMWIMRLVTRIADVNSCINCFIYGVMNKHFRNAYRKIMFFWRKADSNETHTVQTPVD